MNDLEPSKGGPPSSRGNRAKQLWVPVGVLVVGAVLLVIFRAELSQWFGIEGGSPDAQGTAAKHQPPLSPSAAKAVQRGFSGYESIRSALSRDSLEGVAEDARRVQVALGQALEAGAETPGGLGPSLTAGQKAARQLSDAPDLASARQAFGALSQSLILLAEATPSLSQGRFVFSCPMAKPYGKWFQTDPNIENPYMGQKMLQCGGPSEWAERDEPAATADGDVAYWTCPMHPSVHAADPGQCPICGMDLTAVTEGDLKTGTLVIDEATRRQMGVRTSPVTERAISRTIRAVGEVKLDEQTLVAVSLRYSGWINRLDAGETGQPVQRGQLLFTIYSPELFAAQMEYLGIATNIATDAPSPGALLGSARARLRLLGMTASDINGLTQRGKPWEAMPVRSPISGFVLEKNVIDGTHIEAGQTLYRLAKLSPIWVDADVYEQDLPYARKGDAAEVSLPYVGQKPLSGKVDYVYPVVDSETRTGRIRVVLDNPEHLLKPGMFAEVSVSAETKARRVIPESAVIYTGTRRLVFVDAGSGRFRPQEVQLGLRDGDVVEVTDGLEVGESVVSAGNFLIAAESRLRTAADQWDTQKEPEESEGGVPASGGHGHDH